MSSIHYEFSDNCEPAVSIAGFNSGEPGLSSIAQDSFGAGSGGFGCGSGGFRSRLMRGRLARFAGTIPPSFALSEKEYLERCGSKY